MLENLNKNTRRAALVLADRTVTLPFVQWTWSGLGEDSFPDSLTDFRATDLDSVREMMAGRYLLRARLVRTGGASPFSVGDVPEPWLMDLHGFSWLRHFRDARDPGERRFARTLVLDWIGRHGRFDRKLWDLSLTAERVMNWLRYCGLLLEGANADQSRIITRSLSSQIQSLRLRQWLTAEPLERLFVSIAMVAAALCDRSSEEVVSARLAALEDLLSQQIDDDGLHKTRNPAQQVRVLTELITIRQALARRQHRGEERLGLIVDHMHRALVSLTLGTGELAYFNGCGQQESDLVFSLLAQVNTARRTNCTLGGYCILSEGDGLVIADSGRVPPTGFSRSAHASALAFEFSHGKELVIGNCGPAPTELAKDAVLFRMGAAHSGPTISSRSAASVLHKGPRRGDLVGGGGEPELEIDTDETALCMRSGGFETEFGATAERRLTLISGGDTLIGQDRFFSRRGPMAAGTVALRFHTAPGAVVEREPDEDIIRLTLSSGSRWSFLWEGGMASVDDSVRQSAYFGFHRTKLITLEAPLREGMEMAWILTRLT